MFIELFIVSRYTVLQAMDLILSGDRRSGIRRDEGEGMDTCKQREYMEEMFRLLDMLLYAAFQQKREKEGENLSMRGLVITEKEIDQAFQMTRQAEAFPDGVMDEIRQTVSRIRERQASESFLPFYAVCEKFRLNSLERLALLIGAAPLYHRKYERIYGFLQDRVDQLSPTRGLCVTLAEFWGEIPTEDMAEFLSGLGNIEFLLWEKEGIGLAGTYRLRPRLQSYLLGEMDVEELIRERTEYFSWTEEIPPMVIREDKLAQLCSLYDRMQEAAQEQPGMIMICGKEGIGRHFLLKHLARERKLRLFFVDLSELFVLKWEDVRDVLEAAFVESVLGSAQLCLYGCDLEETGEEGSGGRGDCRREIFRYLEEHVDFFLLLAERKEEQLSDFRGVKVCVELPSLSSVEKVRLWENFGAGYSLGADVDLKLNGNKYVMTPRGIREALSTAEVLAGSEGRSEISQEDIRQAVKQNQTNQLGAYATRINGPFVWDDLILGDDQKRQMRMVCDQMKYRDVVGEEWGFHRKTPYGRGLSVLFYGPPGTGKTMAAQVMANELGLDLYRIDISQMVSKYIGETQKNISRLFHKAKDINALLFFDEADSLFARRSEAKDSHDRNANAETAHLLQKLEDYEGITVLATNYLNNIDDAFKRRMKFIIHIAFPEPGVRLRLWNSILPEQALCEEELDLDFFAEHFELSGSSIKEIMVNAAYLAAAEHRGLANRDLVEAVKLNYAKYGKVLTKNDFGYLG